MKSPAAAPPRPGRRNFGEYAFLEDSRYASQQKTCDARGVSRFARSRALIDGFRSLDHDLDLVAGIGVIVGTKPVEDAKALDPAVGDRHAARQALDRVTGCDGHDLDVQRLCRLAFRQRHATEGADAFAKGTIDLRGRAVGGEDEAVDVAAEPHHIEPI